MRLRAAPLPPGDDEFFCLMSYFDTSPFLLNLVTHSHFRQVNKLAQA